jgi:hypothetical protein
MKAIDDTGARDARIRKWIIDNSTELIQRSPLGVTLGLLVTGLRQINNKDLREISDDGFYHRCHRALSEMVDLGLVRKEGKHYFFMEPKDRVLAGLEELIDHAFPGAKLREKDLAPLRAALDGLKTQDKADKRKPRNRKMGSHSE